MINGTYDVIYAEYKRIFAVTPPGMMYDLLVAHATAGMNDEQRNEKMPEIKSAILKVMQNIALECHEDICGKDGFS
ncbi:MAG: hypothetical protein IBX55_21980 [Methyloprofundus sp.]|nr:hypothetical protein [Methyloprofundus sp.]